MNSNWFGRSAGVLGLSAAACMLMMVGCDTGLRELQVADGDVVTTYNVSGMT